MKRALLVAAIVGVAGAASAQTPLVKFVEPRDGAVVTEPRITVTGRAEAQTRPTAAFDVVIAVEEVWNKFLLSPLEFARYVDEFDSPWLKAYFDVGNVVFYGYPQDWIRTLGPRIVKVHLKDFQLDRPNGKFEWENLGEWENQGEWEEEGSVDNESNLEYVVQPGTQRDRLPHRPGAVGIDRDPRRRESPRQRGHRFDLLREPPDAFAWQFGQLGAR